MSSREGTPIRSMTPLERADYERDRLVKIACEEWVVDRPIHSDNPNDDKLVRACIRFEAALRARLNPRKATDG